jgi:uncharacterized repeat protein (TIGR03803 family)
LSNCPDGNSPSSSLLQATNGTFYGTAVYGGTNNLGTIFSLSTGLGPFVSLQTTAGPAGASVTILGTSLSRPTSVTFNGTSATFTFVSSSEIVARVPTGATTGPVQVVMPTGTLNSNAAFIVQGKAGEPSFAPRPGSYARAQSVKISDTAAGAVIYYTTDGTTPTTASAQYAGPIPVVASETIKAVAIAPGFALSAVKSGAYTIR